MPFYPFLGWEGSPTKIDYRKNNRVPTYSNLSSLEDLVRLLRDHPGFCVGVVPQNPAIKLSATQEEPDDFAREAIRWLIRWPGPFDRFVWIEIDGVPLVWIGFSSIYQGP